MCTHQPLTSPCVFTWGIRPASPLPHVHGEKEKGQLWIVRNRSYHLPLCSSSGLCIDQQIPASGIAQTRGGFWLYKACGSHKCKKHQRQHWKSLRPSSEAVWEAEESFQQFLPSPEDAPRWQERPTHIVASKAAMGQHSLALLVLSSTCTGFAQLFLLNNHNQSEMVLGAIWSPLLLQILQAKLSTHTLSFQETESLSILETSSSLTHHWPGQHKTEEIYWLLL